MTPQAIKDHIILNDCLEFVLNELGCKGVKSHDDRYVTGGFPDSDGKKSFTVFLDNLYVDSYTRNIKDKYGNSDIISMVCFIKDVYFSQAISWLCNTLGLDYYGEEDVELPMSLQWTSLLVEMNTNKGFDDEDIKIRPIKENILDTYYKCGNQLFIDDGISLKTQVEFEIGIDLESQRITIPIRDELGTLVGVKGRLFKKNSLCNGDKYIYLEPCSKRKILYGLNKTMKYIKETRKCIVVESEKSVIALWENGIKNVVSIGGHSLSRVQIEKITRLGVDEVILCYDQDVNRLENGKINREEYIKEASGFIDCIKVTAMVDLKGDILNKKESPVDRIEIFNSMYGERKVLQNGKNNKS
ncbi:MAG: toprim domain-containing protein [Clostridium sp.]